MKTPVVLITGALTGIGRATALAFAKEGARIVVSGRRDEVGQKLVTELRETGTEAEYWRADVCHEDDVRDLVNKTVTRFGRLDVAVNNAGTEGKSGPVTEQTAESNRPSSIPTSSACCCACALDTDYFRRLMNAGNTQVVGEDIPPIESVFDLKSGVRAKLVDRRGSMVIVQIQEYRSDWIEWSEVKPRIAAR